MKKFLLALILTCQVAPITNSVYAQNLSTTAILENSKDIESIFDEKLSNKYFPVLNDRISIKMPEGSKNVPFQEGVMSPVSSGDEETRLVLESENGELLIVYAEEMFTYSTGNLKEDAKNLWNKMTTQSEKEYELSEIKSDKDLSVIKINIKTIPEGSQTPLINGAFVRTSDNSLIFVGVYANSQALLEKEKCLKLSDGLISTIKVGKRKLDLSERKEKVNNIIIDVKKDYILTSKSGADFDVFYIKKIVPVYENNPYMGIYFGAYPSFSEQLEGYTKSEITKIKSTILGNKVEWIYYSKNSQEVDETSYMQTLIDTKKNDYSKYIHIFIYPTSEHNLKEMKQIAESLKYIK